MNPNSPEFMKKLMESSRSLWETGYDRGRSEEKDIGDLISDVLSEFHNNNIKTSQVDIVEFTPDGFTPDEEDSDIAAFVMIQGNPAPTHDELTDVIMAGFGKVAGDARVIRNDSRRVVVTSATKDASVMVFGAPGSPNLRILVVSPMEVHDGHGVFTIKDGLQNPVRLT